MELSVHVMRTDEGAAVTVRDEASDVAATVVVHPGESIEAGQQRADDRVTEFIREGR